MGNTNSQNNHWWTTILENLPSPVRSIFFIVISVPLTVAITGMLLNVNIGQMFDSILEDWRLANKHNITQMRRVNDELIRNFTRGLGENTDELKKLTSSIRILSIQYDHLKGVVMSNEGRIDKIGKQLVKLSETTIKNKVLLKAQLKECKVRIIGNSTFVCEGIKPNFCTHDYKQIHSFRKDIMEIIGGYDDLEIKIKDENVTIIEDK